MFPTQRMSTPNSSMLNPGAPNFYPQTPTYSYGGSLPHVVDGEAGILQPPFPQARFNQMAIYKTGPFVPLGQKPPASEVAWGTPDSNTPPPPHCGDYVTHDVPLPLIRLNHEYQLYFRSTDIAVFTTWDLKYTTQETEALLQRLFPAQAISEQARLDIMHHTAEHLLLAATSNSQMSRSAAYLFENVLNKCPNREVAQIFKGIMAEKALALFSAHWVGPHAPFPTMVHKSVNGYQTQILPTGGAPSWIFAEHFALPAKQWEDKLNMAAFLGDLFAVGVISPEMMCDVITPWVANLTTFIQCRGLYLLLLRASYPMVVPMQPNCLLRSKDTLILSVHQGNYWWIKVRLRCCPCDLILIESLKGILPFVGPNADSK